VVTTVKVAVVAATDVQHTTQRVPLPNNSLFVMGSETTARWMHSVHTDKRPENTKDRAGRFHILPRALQGKSKRKCSSSSLDRVRGAAGKTRAEARPVVHGGEEVERLLAGFGAENHESEFDWERAYGEGFDVLHFTTGTPVSA
jgi:hypothetical protein